MINIRLNSLQQECFWGTRRIHQLLSLIVKFSSNFHPITHQTDSRTAEYQQLFAVSAGKLYYFQCFPSTLLTSLNDSYFINMTIL
jgi:hypothetical protein